jgi:hypothetical protein
MDNKRRVEIYLRQVGKEKYVDGIARLTPRQRRRVRKHDNKALDTPEDT